MFLGKGGKSSALMVISAFWAKHLLSPNIQEACAYEMKLVQTIRLFCLLLQTDKNTFTKVAPHKAYDPNLR